VRRTAVVLTAAVLLGGCGPGVHGSAPDRARDTVQSFAAACARGAWPAAVDVLTEGTRKAFLEQADPVRACGTVLGVRALDRDAFAGARVGPVRAHGDEAVVGVEVGASRGRAELSGDGERWRLVLPAG
jgi:hypothetical protein